MNSKIRKALRIPVTKPVIVDSAVFHGHSQIHSITDVTNHTSTATSGQMLKADANGLPVDATNTDTDVASAVTLKHTQGTDTALGAVGTKNPPINADLALYRDSTASNALVTSTWTQVKAFLKTYFDGVYQAASDYLTQIAATSPMNGDILMGKTIDGTWNQVTGVFTDTTTHTLKHESGGLEADVSAYNGLVKITGGATSAVADTLHTQGTDTALGAVAAKNPPIDADKALYRDSTAADALVTSTWTQVKAFLKTYFDTLYVSVTGRYRFAAELADDATQAIPTITANFAAHGRVVVSSAGVINESASFEIDSTGTAQLIHATANIVINADTDGKFCIGTAAAQNPMTFRNRLGGARNVMINLWYA